MIVITRYGRNTSEDYNYLVRRPVKQHHQSGPNCIWRAEESLAIVEQTNVEDLVRSISPSFCCHSTLGVRSPAAPLDRGLSIGMSSNREQASCGTSDKVSRGERSLRHLRNCAQRHLPGNREVIEGAIVGQSLIRLPRSCS